MKRTKKLSNSFLVYSFITFSILIYIFGVFAVINFVQESSHAGLLETLSENPISTILGIICLFLVRPSYRLTNSLRILDITEHENGPAILTFYKPFFINDMQQVDHKIIIQNLKEVRQNNYFNRLVELHFEESGTEQIIKSFISPQLLPRLKEELE